jgi:hypothetical protein
MQKFIPQIKIADMLSMGGAALIGLGAGLIFHRQLVGMDWVPLSVGVVLYGLGMFGKYEIERERINPPAWVMVLLGLSAMVILLGALYLLLDRYVITNYM